MPTYEYTCPAGHDFEHFVRKISDARAELPCPVCGQVAARRISAGAGLIFKGSGFYITDYGKDGKKPQAGATPKGEGAAAGTEGGAGAASDAPGSAAKEGSGAAPAGGATSGGAGGGAGAVPGAGGGSPTSDAARPGTSGGATPPGAAGRGSGGTRSGGS